MTDAYRTSGFTCPNCPNASLREFGNRLVCDECNGMLLEADDLTASIHELDGATEPLAVADEQPSTQACPRCSRAMTTCTLAIGPLTLKGRFMRCDRDGIWFTRDAMTAAFARASRRSHGSVGGGQAYGMALPGGGSGGMPGAMRSIQSAFGTGAPATSGLSIGQWRDTRPRVHTLFVSAHKDRTLGCPSCKETKLQFQGDRWMCSTCAGSFVEDAALTAMVMEMTKQPWEIPAVSGGPGERNCPVCETPMIVEVLEAATIDRCASHGAWFDESELQAALEHASAPAAGVGSWIKQLFHRHGKHTDR